MITWHPTTRNSQPKIWISPSKGTKLHLYGKDHVHSKLRPFHVKIMVCRSLNLAVGRLSINDGMPRENYGRLTQIASTGYILPSFIYPAISCTKLAAFVVRRGAGGKKGGLRSRYLSITRASHKIYLCDPSVPSVDVR